MYEKIALSADVLFVGKINATFAQTVFFPTNLTPNCKSTVTEISHFKFSPYSYKKIVCNLIHSSFPSGIITAISK